MSEECFISSSQDSQISSIERRLSKYAYSNVINYKLINKIEQIIDDDDIVIEETLLVENLNLSLRYSLRIIELRDEDTVLSMIREAEMLRILGSQKYILGALNVFRHRQYIGFLFPPFSKIRDRLDYRYRLKKGKVKNPVFNGIRASDWNEDLFQTYQKSIIEAPGILNRNAVALVLKSVLKALSYIHYRGYIHSQICASNIFMNDMIDIKIGGFLNCRKIDSRTWKFSGNSNCFPPEAFFEQKNPIIKPSFDIWSIGMLTLELISGLRMRHSYQRMEKEATNFVNGNQAPPTLSDIDSSTVKNNVQIYDKHVEEFIALCLQICPEKRFSLTKIYKHKFLRKFNKDDAKRHWQLCLTYHSEWNTSRCLFKDMLSVQSSSGEIKKEFLLSCLKAIKLAEKDFYALVDKVPNAKLIKEYIAIEARLMVQNEGEQWSCDVLDVSHTSSRSFLNEYREKYGRKKSDITTNTPDKARSKPLSGDPFIADSPFKRGLDDLIFQRNETVFFVKQDWCKETRHLFIALQFARWYQRNLINFSDLIRISDEIDDILEQYIFCEKLLVDEKVLPGSVSFLSGIRRTLFESSSNKDYVSRKYNHIYVEVALTSEVVSIMKKKFDELSKDDPADIPQNKTTLQAAATFRDFDIKHLELIEKIMLGARRIDEWDYLLEQAAADSLDPSTQLTTLLKERRRNPNLKFTSYNDPKTSNQARLAKLWSDYDRDFMFRFCKMAVPYRMDEKCARELYADMRKSIPVQFQESLAINDEDDLKKQLLRTRAKQEEDTIYPSKYHDEVEARQEAVLRLAKLVQNHEQRIHQLESIVLQMQQLHANELDMKISSPAPNPNQKLRRLPHNK